MVLLQKLDDIDALDKEISSLAEQTVADFEAQMEDYGVK